MHDTLRKESIKILKELLLQCTKDQVELFNRMYGSVDSIKDDKIDWAIQQCERTVEKNKNNK
jgi:hypothetical protein